MDHTPGKWRQLVAGVLISLGSFIGGISTAWTSVVGQDLQQPNNSMSIEPISDYEASWIVAFTPIGMMTTMLFLGSNMCELFGRKKTALIHAFINIVVWLMRYLTTDLNVLLIAQLLHGASDGIAALVIPLYITEISSDSIRGSLGSLYMFGIKSGYFAGFTLVAVAPIKLSAGYMIILPVALLVGLLLIPESPLYSIRNNRIDEAGKSLMWLRGNDKVTAEDELKKLVEFHKKIARSERSLGAKDLFTDWVNFKGLMIGLTMIIIQQISGIGIMVLYIVNIFAAAKTSISPQLGSIMYAGVHICGCWLSTLMVDKFGRRPLMFLSTLGMAIGYFILGIYFMLQSTLVDVSQFRWLPIIAILLYGSTYSTGAGPLPSVIANEVFNPELASICNTIYVITFGILSFLVMKLFPTFKHAVSLHNVFFGLLVACIVGFVASYFVVPETKGKSIESIRNELQSTGNEVETKEADDIAMDIVTIARLTQSCENK